MPATRDTHYRACTLCEAICGLEIQTDAGRVVSIKGDANDPLSRGHICPKAVALADIQDDPDRLRTPMRRVGERWEPMGWDDAIDLVATRLAEVRTQYGADAIATYQGNPNVHNVGMMTHGGHFLGQLKTKNRYSATSVDQLPHQLMTYWMYGHQLLIPIPDIDHTDFFLMLGANPIASNGSLMTVPDVAKRIKALQARGGKLVVVDPRRTETAEVADAHHFIRPGTDAALLLALLKVILDEGLARPGRLAPLLDGFDELPALLAPFTAEAAARATGIAADTIRELARDFARAERAVCYGRMGCSTQAYGTLCQWAIQLINIATGRLDEVGGALVTRPALDLIASPTSKPGSYGRWASRVSGRPEVLGEFPVAVLAEEMLTPGEGQIKALVTIAGNPVLSTPNGTQLERALGQLDFMVAIDLYLNETTRFADVILPTTAPLEHDHYDMIFNLFAVRNYARYSPATLAKPEGALDDWEVLQRLGDALAEKLGQAVKPAMQPQMMLDFGLQMGPHGMASEHRLSLQALKDAPHGVDLGPLTPSFPERLMTADKRIQCVPEPMRAGLAQAIDGLLGAPDNALRLIGRRHVRSNNSWMHNYHRLVKGKPRHALLMHPQDAASRGLQAGQTVRVASRVGQVVIELALDEGMMPGCVSLPHGWGHHRTGTRLETAAAHAGASANDLTDDRFIDAISGNAALNGVPVTVLAG